MHAMRATGLPSLAGHGHLQGRIVCQKHAVAGSSRCGRYSAPSPAPYYASRRGVRIISSAQKASVEAAVPVITIRMPYRVQFGEVLRVVGSSALLGDWSADKGLQLTWTEGDVWTAEVPISAGHYEFKCVVFNVETGAVTRWEDGGNRILNITQEPGSWDVNCQWGATAEMTQAFTPAPAPPALPPTETPAPAPEAAAAQEPPSETAPAAFEEQVPTFMALSGDGDAGAAAANEEAASLTATSAVPAPASGGESNTATDSASAGGNTGNNAVILLLATCAAGAVAAFTLLAPGGFDKTALGGRANQAVSSTVMQSSIAGAQVRAQVQSQLAALADHVSNVQAQVSAVQPTLRAQVSNVQDSMEDGLSSLRPAVRSGVAYVQGQASALQNWVTFGDAMLAMPSDIVRRG